MSEFTKVQVGKEVSSFEVSPEFSVYSGVEIVDDEGNTELVGNDTGRVVAIPGITKQQAEAILADLTGSGFQYQPYTASDAHLSPAAEIGDGVTINGVYSGIYRMSKSFGPRMIAQLEAPQDEEVDHEFPYEPKQDRIYKREIADAQAAISLTQDQISAEVFRATSAEESLSSAIQQTATEISANVLKKTGGSSSSFGWTLTDSSWELKSNNQTVFKATSSGVEISGKVTATSGTIGGFTITNSSIYNGMNGINSTSNGVYIGTNGIAVGGGRFKVTSSGAVSAANMTLTGTLNIGGTNITAAALRSGAQSAYTNGGSWSTGASNGNTAKSWWDSATSNSGIGKTIKASNFVALSSITAASTISARTFQMNGNNFVLRTATIAGTTIAYVGW